MSIIKEMSPSKNKEIKMKAILIDDEPLALEYLERQINKIGGIRVVDTFIRFEITQEIDLLNKINVVFLDIEMPEMNGLEMAEKIIEINPNLTIVFITAYNNYAVQAFEINALDYILKPVRIERLEKTINRIITQQSTLTNVEVEFSQKLRINVCNDLSFEFDDEIEVINWRTAKAQELFSYLLLNQSKVIHKTDLAELFWSEYETEKAFSLLYTTVYHIRKALKKFHTFLTLKNKQDGYILVANDILIDLIEWEERVSHALETLPVNDNNIKKYEEIMNLYTGSYLQNYDYLWADSERFRLENLWITVAIKIGSYYKENDNFQEAESWFINVCQVRPECEEAHFALLKLYALLNYGILVNHQYEKLSKTMADLGLTVNEEIQAWYHEFNNS